MKLLIGGSPCTHWSIAQTKNRETEASGIGWELFLNYRIARDKYQPDYFLYENNKSMSPAIRAQITAELGVEPVLINSALVSAQNRQRLYWAGKRNPDGTYRQVPVELPEDRGILLRDILETGFPLREKGYALQTGHGTTAEDAIARRQRNAVAEPVAIKPLTEKEMEYMVRETKDGRNHFGFDYFHDATKDKSACVTANTHKGVPYNVLAEPVRIGTIENDARNQDHDSQQYRVYSPGGKSVTLCGNGGGLGAKTGLYATPITPPMQVNEATKLGYTVIQPGECVDLAMPQSKTRRGRAMKDKTNCLTLEQECINSGTLPSIAYGFKRCSLKHKIGTQEKFCNNYQPCKEVWASGQRVQKYIGYDAGETRRIQHAAPIDEADKKYEKHYPLYEWGWTREECVRVIERAGLPKPGKSSCFFCPSMKKKEIQALWENYPDLFQRAIALEHGSAARNVNVKGLGRDWSWESYYNEFMENKAFEDAQITFDELFPDSSGGCLCGAPCGCYDG